jgi:hypothetical protein
MIADPPTSDALVRGWDEVCDSDERSLLAGLLGAATPSARRYVKQFMTARVTLPAGLRGEIVSDNDDKKPKAPPCRKCGEPTRFYARVLDPKYSTTYDLYDCTACSQITSRIVSVLSATLL